jgi:hypothetical protein
MAFMWILLTTILLPAGWVGCLGQHFSHMRPSSSSDFIAVILSCTAAKNTCRICVLAILCRLCCDILHSEIISGCRLSVKLKLNILVHSHETSQEINLKRGIVTRGNQGICTKIVSLVLYLSYIFAAIKESTYKQYFHVEHTVVT